MRYAIDTEFWEKPDSSPTELISLGIAREDGANLYVVNNAFNWKKVPADDWLQKNVRPHLADPRIKSGPPTYPLRAPAQIRADILRFVGTDTPEFWGYFAATDWVLFYSLFGRMIDLPNGWPQMCLDVNQERKSWNMTRGVFPEQDRTQHNALNDAIWTMQCVVAVGKHKAKMVDRLYLGGV